MHSFTGFTSFLLTSPSDDSMEHLTAEERACLMYLEETIEALEVQEDSGLSNDEPDPDKTGRMRVNDISSFKSDESTRVLTNGDEAEHHALNQTPEPQSSPAAAANAKHLETSMDLMTQPNPPVTESVTESVTDCKIHPSATQLCVSTDGDGKLKIVPSASLCPSQSTGASETDVGVIPPPSDFMDEPGLPPQQQKVKSLPPSAGISNNQPGATIDLEQLRQRASETRTSVSSPVIKEPPNKPPELSLPAVSPGLLISPPEAAEPRSPPAVAPKPKKLPSNIILKSHKSAVAGSDGTSGHSVPNDRLLSEPQRIRIEALRKLGLLPQADSGPALSPKLSPKTRRSWAAPPSPISTAAPHTPPLTPSYTQFNSPPPASVPLQSPAAVSTSATSPAPAVQPAEVLAAPAAFSDSVEPPLSDNGLPAVKDASEATVNAQVNTPSLPPIALVKHLTPPKVFKSATLERSGPGLSNYMANQDSNEAGGEQSPSQRRNNRPRPASLGSGKEFISIQGERSQVARATSKEPDLRRTLPAVTAFQHSGHSQKLPRSQGISVLICPRAENEEERREALKKLGLIKD
ncbi:specifically androgen-regulated gene protein-like isoform X1 [Cottoperca gobio]|uniref:Specifically androgen-regulated gene protein-like isoform X1 n=1 Tax=Cottoperca gobio TaxID=56716 RepID=A0A6J2Q2H6_COTGO|nr:specifically androgen-regulated gene protein-like isoform X1 [Cottoperca gobio]